MEGVDGLRASLSCWELEVHKGRARKNVALVSFSGKDTGCPIAFRPGRIRDQGRGRTRRRVEYSTDREEGGAGEGESVGTDLGEGLIRVVGGWLDWGGRKGCDTLPINTWEEAGCWPPCP